MFYQEEIINGVLCHRSLPNGPWIPFTAAELTARLTKAETELNLLKRPSAIDNRMVKCSCGHEECLIGLNFDSDPDLIRLTDKFGNETSMHINKETTSQIIGILKSYKFKKTNPGF